MQSVFHCATNSLDTYYIFVALEYVVLKQNALCEEHNVIYDEFECLEVAILIGKDAYRTISTLTSAEYPRGCYVHNGPDVLSGDIVFNGHPVGSRSENGEPICLKGKFMRL